MRKANAGVYAKVKASGLVRKLKFDVYDCIYRKGPITQSELVNVLNLECGTDRQINSYSPRFNELERAGLIEVVGQRKCAITHQEVSIYDVTDGLPIRLAKKLSMKQKLDEANRGFDKAMEENRGLRDEIASLRSRLNQSIRERAQGVLFA